MENIKLSAFYEPRMALVIYRNLQNVHRLNEFYIESHDIIDNAMSAGKPLTDACFSEISDFIVSSRSNALHVKGVIPINLLYHKTNLNGWPDMVWYVKSGPQQMYFKESLNIPDGFARIPSLVFAYISGATFVFAVKGNSRPNMETQLYQPPFHNCSDGGAICLGSAKLVKPKVLTWESMMKWHEARFFRSIFTHNGSAKVKGNLNLVWKDLIQNPDKKFDTKILIKSKKLKDIIK